MVGKHRFITGSLLATSSLAFPLAPAMAQVAQVAAGGKPSQAQESSLAARRCRRLPTMSLFPVTIIDSSAIQKSGVNTNVLYILRKEVPAFAGRSNTGNTNAGNNNQRTAGGSSIQLRNLDTLVLVNGRRVAPDAISGVNGKAFVNADLNARMLA